METSTKAITVAIQQPIKPGMHQSSASTKIELGSIVICLAVSAANLLQAVLALFF